MKKVSIILTVIITTLSLPSADAMFQSGFEQFQTTSDVGKEDCTKKLVEQTISQAGLMKGATCALDSVKFGMANNYRGTPYFRVPFKVKQTTKSGVTQDFEGFGLVTFKEVQVTNDDGEAKKGVRCGFSQQGIQVVDSETRDTLLQGHEAMARQVPNYMYKPEFTTVFKLNNSKTGGVVHEFYGFEQIYIPPPKRPSIYGDDDDSESGQYGSYGGGGIIMPPGMSYSPSTMGNPPPNNPSMMGNPSMGGPSNR